MVQASRFFIAGLLVSAATTAQRPALPDGDAFLITDLNGARPAIGLDASGGAVTVWDGTSPGDTSGIGAQQLVMGSVLDGTELQVNTATAGSQSRPAVAVNQDGSFVAVWQSVVNALESIKLQRFDSDGLPIDGELRVDSFPTGTKRDPAIAMASNGDFVVVWESLGSAGTDNDSTSIQGQLYAADGSPFGSEFQVNSVVAGSQEHPDVAMLDNGGFIVAWTSGADSNSAIQAQHFAANGSLVDSEFTVSPNEAVDFEHPAVDFDAEGDVFFVWTTQGGLDGEGRRFASGGSDLGFFDVDPGVSAIRLAANSIGDHAAVWTDFFGLGWVKVWSENGSVFNESFLLPTDEGFDPDVAWDGDSSFLVVWSEGGLEILGRRYLGPHILVDGFESGDTSSWSSMTP